MADDGADDDGVVGGAFTGLLSSSLSNNASNNPSVFSVDAFGTFQIKTQWKESDSVSSHTMIMNKNKFFQKSTELKGKWDFLDDEDDEFEPQVCVHVCGWKLIFTTTFATIF